MKEKSNLSNVTPSPELKHVYILRVYTLGKNLLAEQTYVHTLRTFCSNRPTYRNIDAEFNVLFSEMTMVLYCRQVLLIFTTKICGCDAHYTDQSPYHDLNW